MFFKKGGNGMEEIEVVIDTEEMVEYFYTRLIQSGYVPKETEVRVIADLVFDYLVDKKVIVEFEIEDLEIDFWDDEED